MNHKLKIFKSVAYHSSFTKAASQLFISQPAISKAIRTLEDEYKTTFFLRKRNSIELTADGKAFLSYVNRILDIQTEMENQFLNKKEAFPDQITFGVSTTVANYIIPKIIALFNTQFPKVNLNIESENSEEIENLILNQQLDFGITEGKNTNRKLQFTKFIKDEIVLVTNTNNNTLKKETINTKILQEIPLVEREMGSGTREIIYDVFKTQNIKKLNTTITLNSTEAIKNYLYYSNSYALLSINAVREDLINNKLKIIDIKGISIERWFYFVSRTGYKSSVMDYFEKFIRTNHNF
ncbi:LysR family transcriptional regulator [Cellulophaga baltica]|uniref:LysR substrate-binding domain-containing protein n=1 Tax=Cellulophaga TaxID=104264 RepID=UPI001C069D1B|nr:MULTISPECIES: LysR substrate-binding domain-containing protein [Cellulophaga]MBU2996216.1 LysR family transcriptional regulator [Cellulophaga baltica]MDO6767611.1 LysR substrate-binding domain-containing protein [Cellulophaga sp. 1_MG-2023]